MEVFRHHHITENHETVALANLFENHEKQVAAAGRPEPGLPLVTAACDEVQITSAAVSLQILGHD
jgi:hypothetical protein